jgi:hypothetical protein
VLVAQGLFYAIDQLVLAGLLAVGDETAGPLRSLYDVLASQAVQVLTVIIGSVLAGAGQRNGTLYGGVVGVWNGILGVMFQSLQGGEVTAVSFYSQPVLHMAFGTVGGFLGTWLWRPLSELTLPDPMPHDQKPLRPVRKKSPLQLTHARVHWVRVVIGAAIVVGGILFADTILTMVMKASEGRMSIRTSVQERVMTLEICILAIFVGAGFAGAGTWYGSVQGAWVGIFSAAALAGYWMERPNAVSMSMFIMMIAGVLGFSLLAGAFGGRLLPPVPPNLSRRFRPAPV